jgi:hypothetical protein
MRQGDAAAKAVAGKKIPWGQPRAGSIPAPGTTRFGFGFPYLSRWSAIAIGGWVAVTETKEGAMLMGDLMLSKPKSTR